ncbi:hypothetical protein BDR26DRAFT_870497 [Obelidium mucronatum]|nr:hypothetical protein BDR26DRAFT_870497 [Obelidium mucronatum]
MNFYDALVTLFPVDEAPTDNNFPRWMPEDGIYGPFIPTGMERVKLALELAECKPGDHVLDLGCGDGRFCVTALASFGASSATGIDSDSEKSPYLFFPHPSLTKMPLKTSATPTFLQGDIRDAHIKPAVIDPSITILIAFLTPEFSSDFRDILIHHHDRGCRIVAVTFDLANPGCNGVNGLWVYEKDHK